MNLEEFLNPETMAVLAERGIAAGTNLILAALILIVGFIVAGWARGAVRKMAATSERLDDTLGNFFASIVRWAITAAVFIAALQVFGVRGSIGP